MCIVWNSLITVNNSYVVRRECIPATAAMSLPEAQIRNDAYQLERVSWALVTFSMLTQVDSMSTFPAYNIALGFWGLYCAFTKHGRATFGLIIFSLFAIILDIVFCSLSASTRTSTFTFCLVMLILCLFLKVITIYVGAHFFASLGGANSMATSNMSNSSIYDPLSTSMESSGNAMYYPTQNNPLVATNTSFMANSSQFQGESTESV